MYKRQDLTEEKAEMPSIIVGTTFFGIKEFSGRVKEMEDVRNDTFSYFSGVIYIAQKAARDTGTLEETMQMKDSIFRSIEEDVYKRQVSNGSKIRFK